jgi:hypothetical protein
MEFGRILRRRPDFSALRIVVLTLPVALPAMLSVYMAGGFHGIVNRLLRPCLSCVPRDRGRLVSPGDAAVLLRRLRSAAATIDVVPRRSRGAACTADSSYGEVGTGSSPIRLYGEPCCPASDNYELSPHRQTLESCRCSGETAKESMSRRPCGTTRPCRRPVVTSGY